MDAGGTSVKVAVRIRPLGNEDSFEDAQLCINTVPGVAQVLTTTFFFSRSIASSLTAVN